MSIDILNVTEIQRFCMHDGPGVRTTVFLKGCPLRCLWCHNPETQKNRSELLFYSAKCVKCGACKGVCERNVHEVFPTRDLNRKNCNMCGLCVDACPTRALEICGKSMSVDELLSEIVKDKAFYGQNGGVTISGGEPLAQGDATVELLRSCKNAGISTAIETCGYVNENVICAAIPFTDIFLWDIKDTDAERHKKYTGVSNELILRNLYAADKLGAKIRMRCILVNGVNMDEMHFNSIAKIAASLNNLEAVEILPYHAYGGTKCAFLGEQDNGNKDWIPLQEQTERAKAALTRNGIKCF